MARNPLPHARHCRGLTLLELGAVLAVVAIVTTAALPSLSGWVARQRLKSAAEQLAAQLSEARFEAVRRGVAIHFSTLGQGREWCWAIGTAPGLNCAVDQASALRLVRHADHRGVQLVESGPLAFDPKDGRLSGAGAAVVLRADTGETLKVRLGPLGRAAVCSPDGAFSYAARCP